MSGWGSNAPAAKAVAEPAPAQTYGKEYYRNRFLNNRSQSVPVRMALVGWENTAKTGSALSFCDLTKKVVIFDVDNSAKSTVDHIYGNNENIIVIPLHDETDESIFNEDNTVNYTSLIDKTDWMINIVAEDIKNNPDSYDAIIFDGGSTYLKWCEFAMTDVLMNRSKNPINVKDGDRFNQAEWRVRNKLFRNTISRIHSLSVPKAFFNFHLKPIQEYMDDGTGKKVLMTVGERPEWDKGTMRYFSQQIFLSRFMKKADPAAGVKGDRQLSEGEWVVRGTIEEMKGKNMEHIGKTYDILKVKDGEVSWTGFPFGWDD